MSSGACQIQILVSKAILSSYADVLPGIYSLAENDVFLTEVLESCNEVVLSISCVDKNNSSLTKIERGL